MSAAASGSSNTVRLAPTQDPSPDDDPGSSTDEGLDSEPDEDPAQEATWADWGDPLPSQLPCASLFSSEDVVLPDAKAALAYDLEHFGVDLLGIRRQLGLDVFGWIRLVNWVRGKKPSPNEVLALPRDSEVLTKDEYLKPVVEDDPLLQLQDENDDDWSDDDEASAPTNPEKRIAALERQLAAAKQELVEFRTVVGRRLGAEVDVAQLRTDDEPLAKQKRDDDSHYFDSYGENDIHAVMLQDKVRTASYAQFILSNPSLFTDATVLDVGCGTSILSLFAARAGAKRVFAVDASAGIVSRAKQIVKANGLEGVITVIEGKVEEIELPTKVDVIISEWMGYALLYESMLDSVLVARDRFLTPAGVVAPSQARMMLALADPVETRKERVDFWDDVYGFDLSAMKEAVWADSIVDAIPPSAVLSRPVCVRDIYIPEVTPSQLSFSSHFELVSTADRRRKVTALVLYFDTFFFPGQGRVDPETEVKVVREGDALLAEVWPLGAGVGRPVPTRRASSKSGGGVLSPNPEEGMRAPSITSFSTGPESVPTHWKQTVFLLREPVVVVEGTKISGTFHCIKSSTNSRELDVEIHYAVHAEGEDVKKSETVVQMYKVR